MLLGLQIHSSAQMLTPSQMQSDFSLLRKALQEVHPQMYRYTPRPVFDSLFEATQASLQSPMSLDGFYKAMLPLLVALHDGHIKWIVSGKDEHYPFFTDHLFPLKLYFIGEKAWVSGNYGHGNIPLGSEVIAINGQKIATILHTLLPKMTFGDGYTTSGKYEDLNHFFSGFYATHFGPSDTFDIAYLENNEEKIIKLAAVSQTSIKDYQVANKPASQSPFRMVVDENKKAIMTIERFWNSKEEQKYSHFLKEAFRQLKAQGVQHLILDLRNNEGGNENYGVSLYSYLAQKPFRYYDHIKVARKQKPSFQAWTPPIYNKVIRRFMLKKSDSGYVFTFPKATRTVRPRKQNYQGELYVLINGNSFSVTTEFSARVHADGRATFIGQETGGGYRTNSSGMFTIVQLPHSKIDLGIPMFGFQMANVPSHIQHGQGIKPDHTIIPTIHDVLHHKDPVMDYTLRLIQDKASVAVPAADTVKK